MDRPRYWLITLILFLTIFPVFSRADIEEKSSVIGSFIGDANKPQSGITVRLLDSFFLNEVARTVTDRNGQFIMAGVLPGLYLLTIDTASMQGMMKRIQVTSGSPTFIDVRPLLSEEQLKDHNAWDKFKWTIRMAERNPLRDEDTVLNQYNEPEADNFFAMLRNFQQSNNIEGQISYMNVGSGPMAASLQHQMAQFAVQGDLDRNGSWSVNGNFLEGPRSGYVAGGDFRYRMFGHQVDASLSANDLLVARYPDLIARQRITRFLQTPDIGGIPQESNPWIASIDLQDSWRLFHNLEVGYGNRFDYYGYLSDSVGYSPHVKLTYFIDPTFSVHGGFFRNTSAPGNYYLQSGNLHPYVHDVAFVPYGGMLQPETTTGYQSGFDFAIEDFSFSVVYTFEDVRNKIATVDLSTSPVNEELQSMRPFVIFNAKDVSSHGVEITATKKLTHVLSAMVSYNMNQAVPVYIVEKRIFSQRQLFFKDGPASQDFHDFQAGIHADFQQTLTEVNASWKWSSGSPLVFGRQDTNTSLSALDVEVSQGLPVRVFDEAQLKLLVAIRNLLDQNPEFNSNADFQRALLYGMPRVIAGGVLVQF